MKVTSGGSVDVVGRYYGGVKEEQRGYEATLGGRMEERTNGVLRAELEF